MSKTQHRSYLESLSPEVLQIKNSAELSQMATDYCGYFVSRDAARTARNRVLKQGGIMSLPERPGSSLITGVAEMREPTKDDLARLRQICEERNLPFDRWGVYWDKTKESSIAFYNKGAVEEQENRQEEFLTRLQRPTPKARLQQLPSKTLAIPANFDVHIGKHCELIRTGNDYTPDKAVQQVLDGQEALFRMTKPFGVSDVLIPLGNDIVHMDNNLSTTTSGTPQDSYGSVESQIMLATELYIRSIEGFAKNHNVWLCHVHSNHDRVAGWSVSQMVSRYFHNHPRVHCHPDSMNQTPMKYFIFGNTLIIFTHGEIKEEKLLGTIKLEVGKAWSMVEHIVCYTGHIHHKQVNQRGAETVKNKEKDHTAVTVIKAGNAVENLLHVETVRSPSPADFWHKNSAYNNLPAVEMFLHNERSQFARFTHFF